MTNKDEQSVGVELKWTSSSFTAVIRSRLLGAVDHLFGIKVRKHALGDELTIQIQRAVADANVQIIQAAGNAVASAVASDSRHALRTLSALERVEWKLENLTACFAHALEDLKADVEEKVDEGARETDPEVIARWGGYAEEATTDEAREKWGKVLASEVRKPGTFSKKVMRILDELDHKTAQDFKRLCELRVDAWVPYILLHQSGIDVASLMEASLVQTAQIPHAVTFYPSLDGAHWLVAGEQSMVSVHVDAPVQEFAPNTLPQTQVYRLDNGLSLTVVLLTEVGSALSSIIPHDDVATMRELAIRLESRFGGEFVKFLVNRNGKFRANDAHSTFRCEGE